MTTLIETPEYRIEGRDKVTGVASFVGDFQDEGMLEACFLRSPHPHALIRSIDIRAARTMPGVRAVLTGADIRPMRHGRRLQDWPLLAWDRVRLIGDRVAVVAADTLSHARAAVERIRVEYELLPAVLDPADALARDAPVLHPDAGEYHYFGERPEHRHPNIQGHAVHEHGLVDAAFARATRVFQHEFRLARVFQGHLEPHTCIVRTDGTGYHVTTTNKSPFRLRTLMATSLGIAPEMITIDSGYIGGDFGGKGFSIDDYVIAFLARATTRPVRFATPYTDDMQSGNSRHATHIRMRTGVDDANRFIAHESTILYDGGAYAAGKGNANLIPGGGLFTMIGYDIPNVRVDATSVYTNTLPGGHARAPGQPQNSFASESHVDLIARELNIDPFELRRINVISDGGHDTLGRTWKLSTIPAVMDALRREAGLDVARQPGRGRGVSIGARASPSGHGGADLQAKVVVSVTDDSMVEVLTAVSDQGGGAHTVLQRVVADELGIDVARVRIRRGTTSHAPFDLGVGGGRVTPVVGGAAQAGAALLRERLEAMAPGLEVREQLERVAGDLSVVGEFTHEPGLYSTYAYAVEVEVDRETGQVCVTDAVFVADVGTAINPVALHGQLVGGFAFGLGQALFEDLRIEQGVVTTANLDNYKLPSMADVPKLRVVLLPDSVGGGPHGAKSAGELANVSIAAAIANAVHDAVGVRVTSLPITAEKVFDALAGGADS